ncbi:MAG: hypothetical protein ACRDEA_12715 [Microcystaceae cyanobacterium]
MSEEFRLVNRAIGLHPKFGPFALYQVFFFGLFAGLVYFLKELLGFSWIVGVLLTGAFSATFLILLGNRPWLFYSRLVRVPHVVRAGTLYSPLLLEREWGVGSRESGRENKRVV